MVFPATAAPLKNIPTGFFCQQNFDLSQGSVRRYRTLSILFGHQNAERALVQAEFHRAIANKFTIELDRDGLIAFHSQLPGLEVFDLGHTNVRIKHDVLQIFDDF